MLVFLTLLTLSIHKSSNSNCEIPISKSPTTSDFICPLESNSIINETLFTHKMKVKINQENTLEITSTFVLINNDTQPLNFFTFIINKTIDSVFCFDLIDSLQFIWLVNPVTGNLINVTLRYPLLQDEIYAFSVSYKIKDTVYRVLGIPEYFELNYGVNHPRNSLAFNLELLLPIYAEILDIERLEPLFPKPSKISEENDIIKISWEYTNRNINQSDLFLIRYIPGSIILSSENSNKVFLNILSLFVGLMSGSLGVIIFYSVRKKTREKDLVTSLLSKSEQEIIIAINLDGGVSTQRRICDKTGYSKSKVSKILAKLEEKKVLKRDRWGRTNKITIINQSFKQLESSKTANTTSES